MTDREKLTKLLLPMVESELAGDCSSLVRGWVDYLIANGVTIAPEKPCPRPKGWQPMGAKSFIEYCPTCKNDGSDLCGLCVMEIESGYDPKDTVMNTEWIPVTERLPKGKENVLLLCKNGAMFVGYGQYYNDVFRFHIKTALSSTKLLNKGRVSHWMPLPEPPKEE